jgi:hypothetical protein
MTLKVNKALWTGSLALVSGCMPAPVQKDAENTSASSSVVRETTSADQAAPPAAPTAVAPAPLATPIQVQEGPENTQVSLMRVAVTGDVLTVQVSYRQEGTQFKTLSFQAKQVSVIDDKTSQRLSLLQDNQGQYLASPISERQADTIYVNVSSGSAVAWFKFPAPTGPTVSINIPDVGPFDGVPVTRR